jgi:hypothetical protein
MREIQFVATQTLIDNILIKKKINFKKKSILKTNNIFI